MSTKTDVKAIIMIGDEVLRLLSLSDEELDEQAFAGLLLIAELARWRDLAYGVELLPESFRSCPIQ
ncbi:MAG: hypothetical protein ACRES5_02755 [Pseudomonas sp.]